MDQAGLYQAASDLAGEKSLAYARLIRALRDFTEGRQDLGLMVDAAAELRAIAEERRNQYGDESARLERVARELREKAACEARIGMAPAAAGVRS